MLKDFKESVDVRVMMGSSILCVIFVLLVAVFPGSAEALLNKCFSFITDKFGWLFLISVAVFVGFLLWILCSKYGSIRLGKDGEEPEYSTSSWFFMLFAAGMGIGLMFYGTAEPLSHYISAPLAENRSAAAAADAMRITFMHWGIHPWAIYGVIGLALAYFQFRKDKPALFSSCFIPLFGEKNANGAWGMSIDVMAVITTVFGVASSLGFGVIQINSGLNYVFGIASNNQVKLILIVISTILFISSSVSGIDKGVKLLSDINLFLVTMLMLFVFVTGPSLMIINYFTDSLGAYLSGIVKYSFWTDTFNTTKGWVQGWTVFYWAWWMSWGPFVGAFIARISRGRTIREFVIGALFCPVVLSFMLFAIFGGTAIHFDMSGITAIADTINEDISYAMFALLKQLPLPLITSVIGMVLVFIFFLTSADSSTYVCAMMTARGSQVPSQTVRAFWGVAEAAAATVLLFAGGLPALKTGAIIVAVPFMFISLFMIISFVKELRTENV
jgi:glycine betaine transporter